MDQVAATKLIFAGVARFRIKPGLDRQFAETMVADAPRVRANPANLQFEIYRSYDDPLDFLLYQVFADEAAWEAHRTSPETKVSFERAAPAFDGPPQRSAWTPVPGLPAPALGEARIPTHVAVPVFRVKPDRRAALIEEVRADAARSRAAGKTIRFDLNYDPKDPAQFLICARWPDRATWEAHQHDPDYAAFRARTADFYDGPFQRTLWGPALG